MNKQVLVLVLGGIVAGCGRGRETPRVAPAIDRRPPRVMAAVNTRRLMTSVVNPNAILVWSGVKSIITAEGIEEVRPHTEAQWEALRAAAVALLEAGRQMNQSPPARRAGDWLRASDGLAAASQLALRAVEKRSAEELFAAGGEIYEACSTCHSKYPEMTDDSPGN